MNKLMTKIVGATLGLAMAIGVGAGVTKNRNANPVFATDYTEIATFDFSSTTPDGSTSTSLTNDTIKTLLNNSSSVSNLVTSVTNKSGDVYSGKGSGGGSIPQHTLKIGKASGGGAFTFTIGGNDNISKVVVNGHVWKNTSAISVNGSDSQTYATTQSATAHPFEFELANATKTITVSVTTSAVCASSIVLYKIASGGQQGPTALADPNPQYNDSTKKVTWTTDAHATKYQIKVDSAENFEDISITPNPEYDASGLTTGVQHTVQIKAVGDETNYSSTTGSVQFTPTAPFASKNYVLCTSTTDLEAGASYLITSGVSGTVKTMSTTESANNRPETNITITDSKAATAQDTLTITLGGSSGAWTFSTDNYAGTTGYLASGTGSNNHLRVLASADNCTVSFNNNAAIITFSTNTGGRNIVRYNSSSKWFACYGANNTQADVYLWREYTSKTPTELTVTGTPTKLSGYYDSDAFDPTGITAYQVTYSDSSTKIVPASDIVWPPLTANMGKIKGSYTERGTTLYTPEYDISVSADTMYIEVSGTMVTSYYTTDSQWNKGNLIVQRKYTSGKNTADVTSSSTFAYYRDSEMTDAVASPAALGEGENQTIYVKATYSETSNATGYAQVVSVTIEHGTLQSDPLTADEAITKGLALSSKGVTANYYYISGVVSSVEENGLGDPEKQYATFLLDDNNASADFKAYQIQAAEGCSNYSALRAGAEVLIKCKIYKYNSTTIENSTSDSSILSISYTAPTLTGVSLNKTLVYLGVGESDDLVLSPIPVGAELGEITWNTTNPDAVTVDQNGHIAAVGVGDATISATAGGFEATCLIKSAFKATAQYSGSTTNMNATGNAATIGLDNNVFSVDAAKGGNNNFPGLNADGDIRLYSGNDIVVTINSSYTIANIIIDYKSGDSYSKVYVNDALVSKTNGAYAINNESFKIHANGGTIKIDSIDIFYRDATAKEEVERLNTQTELAYRYQKDDGGNFTYSDIVMRFGAQISKDLWSELDTDSHVITGFGVILMDGEMVKNAADVADAMTDMALSTVSEDLSTYLAIDYFVPIANMNEKIGSNANDYFWNLRVSVDQTEMNKTYSAVAYIKVGDEYVLLNMARESVKTLASDYLANRNCDDTTAGGSLQNIVETVA